MFIVVAEIGLSVETCLYSIINTSYLELFISCFFFLVFLFFSCRICSLLIILFVSYYLYHIICITLFKLYSTVSKYDITNNRTYLVCLYTVWTCPSIDPFIHPSTRSSIYPSTHPTGTYGIMDRPGIKDTAGRNFFTIHYGAALIFFFFSWCSGVERGRGGDYSKSTFCFAHRFASTLCVRL